MRTEDEIEHRIKEPAFKGIDIIDEIRDILRLEFPIEPSGRFIHDGLEGLFTDHQRRIPHEADPHADRKHDPGQVIILSQRADEFRRGGLLFRKKNCTLI